MVQEQVEMKLEGKSLVSLNSYLSSGIHIGMKQKVRAMERYIYKVRSDKLAVFNVQKIDEQLSAAAKLLAKYSPKDILVVSRKRNGFKPVTTFAESIGGANVIYGRFYPGTLTNQSYKKYIEPKIILATDPYLDKQAISEAVRTNIPIIAMCDTFNDPRNVDLVISMNNKGRKSIALAYWILAREILKIKGEIRGDAEFKRTLEEFEMPEEKAQPEEGEFGEEMLGEDGQLQGEVPETAEKEEEQSAEPEAKKEKKAEKLKKEEPAKDKASPKSEKAEAGKEKKEPKAKAKSSEKADEKK